MREILIYKDFEGNIFTSEISKDSVMNLGLKDDVYRWIPEIEFYVEYPHFLKIIDWRLYESENELCREGLTGILSCICPEEIKPGEVVCLGVGGAVWRDVTKLRIKCYRRPNNKKIVNVYAIGK